MNVIRTARGHGLGWLPDLPDSRDFSPREGRRDAPEVSEDVPSLLSRAGAAEPSAEVPTSVSLRDRFSPIEDQGPLGSCTANAGVALVEYYERAAFGKHLDASRMFLYKVTRRLLAEKARSDAIILHSLPRKDELPADVDETRHARYWEEAFNGVVMRMALLALVMGAME